MKLQLQCGVGSHQSMTRVLLRWPQFLHSKYLVISARVPLTCTVTLCYVFHFSRFVADISGCRLTGAATASLSMQTGTAPVRLGMIAKYCGIVSLISTPITVTNTPRRTFVHIGSRSSQCREPMFARASDIKLPRLWAAAIAGSNDPDTHFDDIERMPGQQHAVQTFSNRHYIATCCLQQYIVQASRAVYTVGYAGTERC